MQHLCPAGSSGCGNSKELHSLEKKRRPRDPGRMSVESEEPSQCGAPRWKAVGASRGFSAGLHHPNPLRRGSPEPAMGVDGAPQQMSGAVTKRIPGQVEKPGRWPHLRHSTRCLHPPVWTLWVHGRALTQGWGSMCPPTPPFAPAQLNPLFLALHGSWARAEAFGPFGWLNIQPTLTLHFQSCKTPTAFPPRSTGRAAPPLPGSVLCAHLCVHVCVSSCVCACACVRVFVCVFTYVCIPVCMHVCSPVLTCVCVFVCTCVHLCMHSCVHVRVHGCRCMCVHAGVVSGLNPSPLPTL